MCHQKARALLLNRVQRAVGENPPDGIRKVTAQGLGFSLRLPGSGAVRGLSGLSMTAILLEILHLPASSVREVLKVTLLRDP